MNEKGGGGFKGAQAAFMLVCLLPAIFGCADADLVCNTMGYLGGPDRCWAVQINEKFDTQLQNCYQDNSPDGYQYLMNRNGITARATVAAINGHPEYSGPDIMDFVSTSTTFPPSHPRLHDVIALRRITLLVSFFLSPIFPVSPPHLLIFFYLI